MDFRRIGHRTSRRKLLDKVPRPVFDFPAHEAVHVLYVPSRYKIPSAEAGVFSYLWTQGTSFGTK
jgi:hypothetical protein